MGVSQYAQASELQADAFALDSFAKRIGSRVNSLTKVEFIDERKSTHSKVETSTGNTLIQNQLESKKYQYIYNGQYYTYVRLKMTEEGFNALKNRAGTVMKHSYTVKNYLWLAIVIMFVTIVSTIGLFFNTN
jgi:hypothetical protein